MAHFWGPSGRQTVPAGVVYYEKLAEPHAPHEVWKIDVPTGVSQVSVNLWRGAALTVTSNNPGVIANPIPETVDGDNRILRLTGASTGTSMIEVTDSGGGHWIHLQVHVVDTDPTRAGTQGSQGTAPASAPQAGATQQEPVAELLGLIDKQLTDVELADERKVVTGFLFARKVSNIVKVFLYGYRALAGRNLPRGTPSSCRATPSRRASAPPGPTPPSATGSRSRSSPGGTLEPSSMLSGGAASSRSPGRATTQGRPRMSSTRTSGNAPAKLTFPG